MQTKPMTSTQALNCPPGALPGGLTRTQFFDGMFLTQADLENEQVYWRMKRRLTNRALGAGVVWGLRLTFDDKNRRYRLSPGYALDCCGNDLIVECPIEVTEAQLLQQSQSMLDSKSNNRAIYIPRPSYCVVLQYVECPDSIRAVQRDACSPSSGGACEPSRIRESCRLLLVPECAESACDPIEKFKRSLAGLQQQSSNDTAANSTTEQNAGFLSGFKLDKAPTTLGAWLLAGLQGYFATAQKYHATVQSQLVVSYMLQNAVGGLLGLDLSAADDDTVTKLGKAIGELSADLCKGLLYPGPRCTDEHHGVYLGCMSNKRSDLVPTFSPWECRREVLTGPLVNWWLCQFGAQPLDVMMNRIAQMACDAAGEGYHTALGNAKGVTEKADAMVADSQQMSPMDFAGAIIQAATGGTNGSRLVKIATTAPNGNAMTMMVPASAIAADSESQVAKLAEAQLSADRNVTPLSRGPLRDLVSELGARTPASAVASGVDPNAVKALGTMTVSELLDAQPEALLAKIGGAQPTDAQRAAVNQLYLNAEAFVRDTTTATAAGGKAGVTRAQLSNADLKAALQKIPGVTASAIDAAAAAASKQ